MQLRFARRISKTKKSFVREIFKFLGDPEMISFSGGFPNPDSFPVDGIKEAAIKVLEADGANALQYSSSEGYLPLRQYISKRYQKRFGLVVDPSEILICNGSQQAFDLIAKVFLEVNDTIVIEYPAYLGALQSFGFYEPSYKEVKLTSSGLDLKQLEEALKDNPKLMYVVPNFQNPTGTTLPVERRKELIEIADRYGVPIIEDDPYGQLRYEGDHLPAVELLDSQMRVQNGSYTGNVIYLSTFSKILAPGLRLAWVIAPKDVISKLALAKQGVDLHTSTFNQIVAHEVGQHGFIDRHVKVIQRVYHERRDAMLESLEEHMPEGVTWTHPEGGLFLWLRLPEQVNATSMLQEAIEEKVAYVPGEFFHPLGDGQNTMRLNFSYCNPEKINEGINRLAKAIKRKLVL